MICSEAGFSGRKDLEMRERGERGRGRGKARGRYSRLLVVDVCGVGMGWIGMIGELLLWESREGRIWKHLVLSRQPQMHCIHIEDAKVEVLFIFIRWWNLFVYLCQRWWECMDLSSGIPQLVKVSSLHASMGGCWLRASGHLRVSHFSSRGR